jgi:hypothetical protein
MHRYYVITWPLLDIQKNCVCVIYICMYVCLSVKIINFLDIIHHPSLTHNVQKVCHFNNTPFLQTFRVHLYEYYIILWY